MNSNRERPASATRDRIIAATLETLEEDGFAELSARAIAARGGFNQALIFYHFGSLANLLLEAFERRSNEQIETYRAAAADVTSLSDLVEVARGLHADDMETGHVTAVVQLMAAASDPEQRRALLARFEAWIELVREALTRALTDTPFSELVPTREAAYAIASMFLGIELLARLDPDRSEADRVFDMMTTIARLGEQLGPALSGLVGPAASVTPTA
jgi:AcrR family transcriptional regulator